MLEMGASERHFRMDDPVQGFKFTLSGLLTGEPVCLDKMASYSACLGPELAERFKTAAAQCYFDANGGDNEEDEEVSEEVIEDRQRPGKGKGKKVHRGRFICTRHSHGLSL